jgi:ketosteroid isomerase-like protein
LIGAFEFVERDVVSLVIDSEQAAVHCRVKLRFIPKDRTITTDLLDLWTFRDGKVVELVEFVDTALVNELMR